MDFAHVVAGTTAAAMLWFRIKKLRPHLCGDLLCLAVVFFCLILMDVMDMRRVLTYTILAVIITHLCARIYDYVKKDSTDDSETPVADPETKTSQPQRTAATPSKPQPQQTAAAPSKPQPQRTAATPSKPQPQQTAVVPNRPRVQQTLKDCLRCGKALYGAKCRHCGFDYIAQPVYMLCLVPPQKLQIQIDDET